MVDGFCPPPGGAPGRVSVGTGRGQETMDSDGQYLNWFLFLLCWSLESTIPGVVVFIKKENHLGESRAELQRAGGLSSRVLLARSAHCAAHASDAPCSCFTGTAIALPVGTFATTATVIIVVTIYVTKSNGSRPSR